MDQQPTVRQHYPALDGMRGLAILLVVVYHNFGFINYFFFGWLGVDLFFVLSGFLITGLLLDRIGTVGYLKNFYYRRALRIFPLYYLLLIVFLLILPKFSLPFPMSYYVENQWYLWTYLQNWLYIFKDPNPSNALNHLWSLAVEEQFYLVWPFLILLIKNPKHLLLFLSLLLLAIIGFRIWIWNSQVTNLAYFNLYTYSRIDGICIGCMVAVLQRINPQFLTRNTAPIVLSFAGLNFLFFFINRTAQFSFPYLAIIGYTTFAMLFGLLVNEAVQRKTPLINKVFSISFLRFFGRISYGFYMLHWPIYLLLTPYLYKIMQNTIPSNYKAIIISLVASIIAVLVSWLSYRYFEYYFLRLKDRFT